MTRPSPFAAGMHLRVALKPGNPGKAAFEIGAVVLCVRVTPTGLILTDKHTGFFNPDTFEKA